MIIRFFNKIDERLFLFIRDKAENKYELSMSDYFDARKIINGKREYLLGNIREVYSNTASLLTHISAMIAVLGILLVVFKDNSLTTFLVIVEMIMYAFLAAVCVHNIRWNNSEASREIEYQNDPLISYYSRYKRKKYLYKFSTDAVFYVTIAFIFTLILHLVGSFF